MECSLILAHYGELALKGKNRHLFEKELVTNLRESLSGFPKTEVVNQYGRILIRFGQPAEYEKAKERLNKVFGLANFSPAFSSGNTYEEIRDTALRLAQSIQFDSFAVRTRRANKQFPMRSQEINVKLGAEIEKAFSAKVDLEKPDLTVHVEVTHNGVFLYADRQNGPGGLPVGVSGKIMSLVSGGIDSPVATLKMLKRGCRAVLVHFHSAPFTDKGSQEKVEDFARLLLDYQPRVKLYLVALAEIQQAIIAKAPSPLRVLLYRRYMLRIAERLALQNNCRALVTGEALAQVASQTLENIAAVEKAVGLPILRPLIGMDKNEIIIEARRYGTFGLSIEDGQDCCSFMSTRHPALKSNHDELAEIENHLALDELIGQAIKTAVKISLTHPDLDVKLAKKRIKSGQPSLLNS